MNLNTFIHKLDELVLKWNNQDSLTPRKELEAIYDEIRNSTAFALAEAVRQRDEAMAKLHKKYLKGEIPR